MYNNKVLAKIDCPIYVILPRKTKKDKKIYINLNAYRNLNAFTENACKRKFAEIIKPQVDGLTLEGELQIMYKVYKQSARRLDKMNVVSIVSKYLMDALIDHGVIEDDNDDFIKEELVLPSEIDRVNPRIEVFFYKK